MYKKLFIGMFALLFSGALMASQPGGVYKFDEQGQHQFVMFKISHLGYSWLYGRFNDFSGEFKLDAENPQNSSVTATIQTASIDSNHADIPHNDLTIPHGDTPALPHGDTPTHSDGP